MTYVFDIDGTISFNGVSIDENIIKAIKELIDNNHRVIFASARPIRDMVNIIPNDFKDCTWIGGNGAFIKFDNNIESIKFDQKSKEKIYDLLLEDNLEYLLDSDWDFTYKGSKSHPLYKNINKKIANNIDYDKHKSISKFIIFNYKQSHIDYFNKLNVEVNYHANEDLMDISPGKCDKHQALVRLGVKDYIAFGNDANDLSMFKHAKESYCVGESEYAKYSNYVISSYDVADSIISLLK